MTLRFTHRIIAALVSHLALFCAMILNSSAQLLPTLAAYDSGGGQALAMAVADFNRDGIPPPAG